VLSDHCEGLMALATSQPLLSFDVLADHTLRVLIAALTENDVAGTDLPRETH
jgi:hypothetical protein